LVVRIAEVRNKREFITLLERVLDELYDPHTHLKVNTNRSSRSIPTGLDVWAEWKNGKAIITQLRRGFNAEQAGLEVGMEIVSINRKIVPYERNPEGGFRAACVGRTYRQKRR
jgi:predicted metalloprotease with PDZ domain